MTRVVGSVWTFLAAAVILTACIFILVPSTSASAQRIAHLESLVRCPSCEDISVAQSNAESARAVRIEIAQYVHEGWSDTTILTHIEDQYGTAILLTPSGSSLDDLLWAVPVLTLVVGLALYGRLVRRRT